MFYVYILKSKKDGQFYIGSTNNLRRRFKEHNEGKVSSRKHRIPFELIFYEAYKAEKDARKRESNLKLRSKAFAQLKKRITHSIKSNGGTPRGDFGVGSTPTPKNFGVGVNGSS